MEWISIKVRVPTEQECEKDAGWFLLAKKEFGRPYMSRYDGHDPDHSYEHGWKYAYDDGVTHWMILPDMPDYIDTNM